ncbi:DUF883 family protein [Rhodobacteraceae bacterium 2376]|uniref:DUF883 family protein n=1 Tax=Rhabdonatronobacter sediminivivens TaxID=2743469 RepID=A0A7Z0I2X1_9RHOB|nr:DUF883 family protein [Rhabdonatronobacter sediminivivens]NYS26549.1 DUF883 family protein [Rhabdonatronobacter sediminivivens]
MAQQTASDIKDKAADVKDKAAEHARSAAEDLSEDLAMLKMQIEELTTNMAGLASKKVEAGAHHIGATARDGYDKAADTAETAYAEVERYTSERPVEALGIAAGIGLLAGLFLARR